MLRLLKNLPFQLVICICIAIFFSDSFSPFVNHLSFTISYLIKELFLFALPFVIFAYVTFGLTSFENQGLALLIVTLVMIIISNAIACMFGYGVGILALPFITTQEVTVASSGCVEITSLTTWTSPKLVKPVYAMLAAFIFGIGNGFVKNQFLTASFIKMKAIVEWGLQKLLIPVLPLYVFGFLIKLKCEGQINSLLSSFGSVFLIICAAICIYVSVLFLIASRMTKLSIFTLARDLFAPALTGFSTMSSAASMPVSMQALQKIVPHNKKFVNFILPTTANANLAGDAISITIMCLTVGILKGNGFLPFDQFAVYVAYYCMLKFSSAGIPGGGVLVLAPLFQSQLGLDFASTTLITTLYILQDPVLTASNVTGNALFALIVEKVYSKWKLFKS